MPAGNPDLHGNAPDKADTALLLIDVINDLEFDGGDLLLEHMLPVSERLSRLKATTKAAGIPSIYVNDNFGRWQSDFRTLVDHCLHSDVRGKAVVERLRPDDDDYFVLKPTHSGFYATPLDLVLGYLNVRRLIFTGVAGNICVLFTAHEAFIRDYRLLAPSDCIASNRKDDNDAALAFMESVLKADTTPSTEIEAASFRPGVRKRQSGKKERFAA